MRHAARLPITAFFLTIAAAIVSTISTAQDFDKVTISPVPAGSGVTMLTGAGGNIGVCAGADGVILIDDQFAPLSDKIRAAVAQLSDKPIRFLVNTHWHGDHTGGNENFGAGGALIVAHENVRKRMSVEQISKLFDSTTPPSPAGALPVVTFTDRVSFHMNGQEIQVIHFEHAHTDGDAVIRFTGSNTIHMGDIYFNGMYPFIDTESGGSIQGVIAALDEIMLLLDPNTKIIPGHGPLTDVAGLRKYRDVLADVAAKVETAVKAGKTREEVVAMKPSAAYDETWGKGFIKPDTFATLLYDSFANAK